jgi:hypothetical protein
MEKQDVLIGMKVVPHTKTRGQASWAEFKNRLVENPLTLQINSWSEGFHAWELEDFRGDYWYFDSSDFESFTSVTLIKKELPVPEFAVIEIDNSILEDTSGDVIRNGIVNSMLGAKEVAEADAKDFNGGEGTYYVYQLVAVVKVSTETRSEVTKL